MVEFTSIPCYPTFSVYVKEYNCFPVSLTASSQSFQEISKVKDVPAIICFEVSNWVSVCMRAEEGILSDIYFAWFGRTDIAGKGIDNIVKQYKMKMLISETVTPLVLLEISFLWV